MNILGTYRRDSRCHVKKVLFSSRNFCFRGRLETFETFFISSVIPPFRRSLDVWYTWDCHNIYDLWHKSFYTTVKSFRIQKSRAAQECRLNVGEFDYTVQCRPGTVYPILYNNWVSADDEPTTNLKKTNQHTCGTRLDFVLKLNETIKW